METTRRAFEVSRESNLPLAGHLLLAPPLPCGRDQPSSSLDNGV